MQSSRSVIPVVAVLVLASGCQQFMANLGAETAECVKTQQSEVERIQHGGRPPAGSVQGRWKCLGSKDERADYWNVAQSGNRITILAMDGYGNQYKVLGAIEGDELHLYNSNNATAWHMRTDGRSNNGSLFVGAASCQVDEFTCVRN